MYIGANRRSVKFGQELKVVEALRTRIAAGDGWTRLRMKEDGQEIDVDLCYGGKYHVTFPPYYGDRDQGVPMIYKPLDEWFGGLDEVAEFLLAKGWQRKW